jgi:CBS domain-containing protein
MRAKEMMTKNPITVQPDTLVLDAQKIMKENNIRRLPFRFLLCSQLTKQSI